MNLDPFVETRVNIHIHISCYSYDIMSQRDAKRLSYRTMKNSWQCGKTRWKIELFTSVHVFTSHHGAKVTRHVLHIHAYTVSKTADSYVKCYMHRTASDKNSNDLKSNGLRCILKTLDLMCVFCLCKMDLNAICQKSVWKKTWVCSNSYFIIWLWSKNVVQFWATSLSTSTILVEKGINHLTHALL